MQWDDSLRGMTPVSCRLELMRYQPVTTTARLVSGRGPLF